MLSLIIKILLCLLATWYSIALLRGFSRLAKRLPLIKVVCIVGVIVVHVFHHNLFYSLNAGVVINLSNHQIIKLIVYILAARFPLVFLNWLLSVGWSKKENDNALVKDYGGSGFCTRSANKGVVVNGISSVKPAGKFLWALMLLALSGNWLSHHVMFCLFLLCAFFIYKSGRMFLKFFKIRVD